MRRSSCGFYELCSEIAGSVAWLPLQDPSFLLASGESLHDLTVVPVEQLLLRWLNTQLEEVRRRDAACSSCGSAEDAQQVKTIALFVAEACCSVKLIPSIEYRKFF